MKDKKNLVIGALLVAVVMMSIGYAAFAQTLNINGTATIDGKWQVEITGIEGAITGTGEAGSPSYTKTTATFAATLKKPGDAVEYTITVENKGTIEAELDSLTFVPATNETSANSTDYILYSVTEAPAVGSKLAPNGGTATYKVKATYNETKTTAPTTEEATKDFTGTIEYVQAD